MKLQINNFGGEIPVNTMMLQAIEKRMERWDTATHAELFLNAPDRTGNTEYLLTIYNGERRLIILCVYLRAGSETVEFHS